MVFRNPCIDRYNTKLVNVEKTDGRDTSDKIDGAYTIKEGVSFFDTFITPNGDDTKTGCSIATNNEITFLPTIEKPIKDNNTIEKPNQINSCKILQRKLELKVERAKRNYSQLHEEIVSISILMYFFK